MLIINAIGGTLQVVLAGVLVWLNFSHRPTRVLATVLFFRGVRGPVIALITAGWIADQPWGAMTFYAFMAFFVALAYFASIYPTRRAWAPPAPWTSLPFWSLGALLFAVRLRDASLFSEYNLVSVLFALMGMSFAVVALQLVREYVSNGPAAGRTGGLLVAAGFALVALYDSIAGLPADVRRLFSSDGAFGVAVAALALVELALFGLAIGLAARHVRRVDARRRAALSRLLVVLLFCAATGIVAAVARATGDAGAATAVSVGGAIWDVALPLLAFYALVSGQLFGIDVKIKWTLKQSTVAAIFLVVFFAVSESAQAAFSDRWGAPLGIAAAAGLLFAIHPLQHVAQRVADKAMPGVKAVGEMSGDERAQVYSDTARVAWADGQLSTDERRMLEALRRRLGLSGDDASRLEAEVMPP